MCLGRPQAKRRSVRSTRSQPGLIGTPVVCSRWALSRAEVQTSNGSPSPRGGVSTAASSAAR